MQATLDNPAAMKNRISGVDKLEKLITIKADDSGNLPAEIEILQTGMWDAPYHGVFMITPTDLQQYVDNFNTDIRASSSSQGLPIDYEHDADGGAAGWITGLRIGQPGDPTLASQGIQSLWAQVDWTPPGAEAVQGGVYKFISPEFCPEGYIDPEGQLEPCDNVLIGAGLTNRPLLKGLKPVAAHDGSQDPDKAKENNKLNDKLFISVKANQKGEGQVDLSQIRTKDASDLSDDEKKFLADHKAELSADEAAKFGLDGSADSTVDNQPANTNTNEDVTVTTPAPAATAPVAASEGQVVMSKAEVEALKASAEKGVLAHAQLERSSAAEHINSLCFNEQEGVRLKPELRDQAVEHYLSLNDKQRESFDALMEGVKPVADRLQFTDKGTSADPGAASNSAENQLRVKANELVKEEGITYADAIVRVASENPSLAKAYETEVYGGNIRKPVGARE